jgi:hypothetical protein
MPRIRRGGKRIRGSNGGRTRNEDCCCGDCTETTPQGIAEYIRDNAIQPTFTIEGTDYTDVCASGNCSPIAGTYSLPFDFIFHSGGGNYEVDWSDTFTLTTCGTSRSIFVRLQMFITTAGGVTVALSVNSSFSTPIDMYWVKGFTWSTCNDILSLSGSLDPEDRSGGSKRCYTLATNGSVDFSI